jgi:hypothetical protein
MKSADKRKPKGDTISEETAYHYASKCRVQLRKHHEEMKDDPERLTTEFLARICRCECRALRDDDNEADRIH